MHRTLLLFAVYGASLIEGQSRADGPIHFASNAQSREDDGRLAWIVDESMLPWTGAFQYLSSLKKRTALLTVADPSSGVPFGECSTESFGNTWERFQWNLTANDLTCTVSHTNTSRIRFTPSPNGAPRTFSIRIQASRGPRCMAGISVQGERPVGCPPRLARDGFSQVGLQCGCPHLLESETPAPQHAMPSPSDATVPASADTDSGAPSLLFPRVDMGASGESASAEVVPFTRPSLSHPSHQSHLSHQQPPVVVNPCVSHVCSNGGKCVVTEQAEAKCNCIGTFRGAHCERDVCAGVPCSEGSTCVVNAATSLAECICPPGRTGFLCTEVVCDVECVHGECVWDGEMKRSRCDCADSFVGVNCNVNDPCHRSTECTRVWGPSAQCTVDPAQLITVQHTTIKGTPQCLCNGNEFTGAEPVWLPCADVLAASVGNSSAVAALLPSAQPRIAPQPETRPTIAPVQTTTSPLLPLAPHSSKAGSDATDIASFGPFASRAGMENSEQQQQPFVWQGAGAFQPNGQAEKEGRERGGAFPAPAPPTAPPRAVHITLPQRNNNVPPEPSVLPPVPAPSVQHPAAASFPSPQAPTLPPQQPAAPFTHEPMIAPISSVVPMEPLPFVPHSQLPVQGGSNLAPHPSQPVVVLGGQQPATVSSGPTAVRQPSGQLSPIPPAEGASARNGQGQQLPQQPLNIGNVMENAKSTMVAFPTPGTMPPHLIPSSSSSSSAPVAPPRVVEEEPEDPFDAQSPSGHAVVGASSSAPMLPHPAVERPILPPVEQRPPPVVPSTVSTTTRPTPTTSTTPSTTTTLSTTTPTTTALITEPETPPAETTMERVTPPAFIPVEVEEEEEDEHAHGEDEEDRTHNHIRPPVVPVIPAAPVTPLNRRPSEDESDGNSEGVEGTGGAPSAGGNDVFSSNGLAPQGEKRVTNQDNANASWIVALVAVIVLVVLLLATSMVVLRYVRQSRKLHGKYNPAREEHALSSAYAMPMATVCKDERLI